MTKAVFMLSSSCALPVRLTKMAKRRHSIDGVAIVNMKIPPVIPEESEEEKAPVKGEEVVTNEPQSRWRELLPVISINLVTLLQGASLSTSAISTPALRDNSPSNCTNFQAMESTSWPRDVCVDDDSVRLIQMSWMIGHLISGLVANPVAELIGRKRSLLLDTFAFAVGFVMFASGESVAVLCLGRALLGYPLVSMVYQCELVQTSFRGISAAIFAISHSVGYSLTLLLGATLSSWRLASALLSAFALPALLAVALLVPESPLWLLREGKLEEAERSLRLLRDPRHDVKKEFDKLRLAAEENHNSKLSLNDLKQKKFFHPLMILIVIFVGYGWSGFVYISLNAVSLFKKMANGNLSEHMISFFVSLIKIPGGLFAIYFLRRFPRRLVFFTMATLVFASHVLLALSEKFLILREWGALVALTGALFGYSAGYNSVGNLLQGELLPADVRSVGVGIVATSEVISSLCQNAFADAIEDKVGKAGLFLVFAGVVLLLMVFSVGFMPETSTLTLEQIENKWQNDRSPGCSIRRDPAFEYRRFSRAVVANSLAVVANPVVQDGIRRTASLRPSILRRRTKRNSVDDERRTNRQQRAFSLQ